MAGEVVLPATDLQGTIDWFEAETGFRMMLITPADDPSIAVLEGHGLTLRLDRSTDAPPATLRIPAPENRTAMAPNGTIVNFTAPRDELPDNEPEFVLSRFAEADFGSGRAGMAYRDLIPNRQGGRFIASHISIPEGGPVPDYVHHHHVRFQMIFCHAGWADLVYEDQGPAFRMNAGDCVLQPPHIRHRVLATSDRFEVVEIGCPAVHDTRRDHELELPTLTVDPSRDFGGQRFVWHRATEATTVTRGDGSRFTNFGIDDATEQLATVGLVDLPEPRLEVEGAWEFLFWFVRAGEATLLRNDEPIRLTDCDSVTLNPSESYSVTDATEDFQLLEVRL